MSGNPAARESVMHPAQAASSDDASGQDRRSAPASDHLALFNRPAFHDLNVSTGQEPARFDHFADGRLVGSLVGVVDSGTFVSGYSAPFGGPDFVRDSETVTNVIGLVRHALDKAAKEGISCLQVKAKPSFYSASEEAVQFALLNLGFTVETAELNHHIDLTGMSGAEDYLRRLKPPARRALKHAVGEPFEFARASSEADWVAGYDVLRRNREAKGRRLRLPLEYVLRIRDTFPTLVRLFTLSHDSRPCAAALVYRVRPRHDLVVYWGDAGHDLPRSPMNLLVQRLVEGSIDDGVLSLDVGISTEHGVPNQGLIQFKESVLARPGLRLDLVRHL